MAFCHLQENLVMKKTLMDTSTKTGMDAAKIASKRVVEKTAEATRYLIGNKIADKITSIDKPKERTKEIKEIYIPPEKRQQIIDDYLKYCSECNSIECNSIECNAIENKICSLLFKNGISENRKFS